MTSGGPTEKRYTAANGTLRMGRMNPWEADSLANFTIVLGDGTPLPRRLNAPGRNAPQSIQLANERNWANRKACSRPLSRIEQPEQPWKIWELAFRNLDNVQINAAPDGSGQWTLELILEKVLDERRRQQWEREDKELEAFRAQLAKRKRYAKDLREQEADTRKISINADTQLSKAPVMALCPPARGCDPRGSSIASAAS